MPCEVMGCGPLAKGGGSTPVVCKLRVMCMCFRRYRRLCKKAECMWKRSCSCVVQCFNGCPHQTG